MMSKHVLKELPALLEAGVLTPAAAEGIREYYRQQDRRHPDRLLLVFGILGAMLTGLGITLLLAHNWDQLPRTVKILLAFVPLLAGQLLCAFALLRRKSSALWKESTATFLFFAVAAVIALISQIYHMPGSLSSFLQLWMLLTIPLVYVMQSSVVSSLYLLGITWYACEKAYWSYPSAAVWEYWLMLLLLLPYYIRLWRRQPAGNFTLLHHWLFSLSVVAVFASILQEQEGMLLIACMNLFGLFYLAGSTPWFEHVPKTGNAYLLLGGLGTTLILLVLSFRESWEPFVAKPLILTGVWTSLEFMAAGILFLVNTLLLYRYFLRAERQKVDAYMLTYLLFVPVYVVAFHAVVWAAVLVNLLVLLPGIAMVWQGSRKHHLGILNRGLMLITLLIGCRFFDLYISFVWRGIVFIGVGVAFFTVNYYIIRKKRKDLQA